MFHLIFQLAVGNSCQVPSHCLLIRIVVQLGLGDGGVVVVI